MTIKIEKSKELKELIEQFQKERGKQSRHQDKSQEQAESIEQELIETRDQLEQAMDDTLELSNEANLAKERELRRKIAELELDLEGARARKSRAFHRGSNDATAVAKRAVTLAKEEAQTQYHANIDEAKAKVADAKYAYLKSLIEYREFTDDVSALFFDVVRAVDQPNTDVQRPHVEELRPFLDSRTYDNYYGILEHEVNNAYKYGKIERGSVKPEREIR